MSRSSITVWKAARSSVIPSMPACPDDFSEPAYAELAFGKACHVRLHKGIAGFVDSHGSTETVLLEKDRRYKLRLVCSETYMQ